MKEIRRIIKIYKTLMEMLELFFVIFYSVFVRKNWKTSTYIATYVHKGLTIKSLILVSEELERLAFENDRTSYIFGCLRDINVLLSCYRVSIKIR